MHPPGTAGLLLRQGKKSDVRKLRSGKVRKERQEVKKSFEKLMDHRMERMGKTKRVRP